LLKTLFATSNVVLVCRFLVVVAIVDIVVVVVVVNADESEIDLRVQVIPEWLTKKSNPFLAILKVTTCILITPRHLRSNFGQVQKQKEILPESFDDY
jgi:hypothetical protein